MRPPSSWLLAALAVAAAACNGSKTAQVPSDREPTAIAPRRTEMTTSGSGPTAPIKTRAPDGDAAATARPRSEKSYPEELAGSDALPTVASSADLITHDGAQARVVGTYVERDVRMKPGLSPVHGGHVALELADGTSVSLLPVHHKDARRPEAEVARFGGQQVEVVGVVFRKAPADPSGGASPTGPAVVDVRMLRAAR